MRNVERGAADVFAVADDAVFLREQGFGENRGHPQNGGKPHPENRTRPACGNGGCHAGDVARADAPRLVLAGGLRPETVGEAIRQVGPFAVDVSSGIQGDDPRKKDTVRMERFMTAVLQADADRARAG